MAAATFTAELKSSPNADGTTSVRIRITRNRQKAYLNLGIRLRVSDNERKSEWNYKHEPHRRNWVKTHRLASTYNTEIQDALEKLDRIGKKHPTYSAKEIKQEYEGLTVEGVSEEKASGAVKGILAYLEETIRRYRSNQREAYAQHYESVLKSLKAFAGKETRDAKILTPAFLTGYVAYLQRQRKKDSDEAKYKPKSIKMYVASLKKAYKAGVLEGVVQQSGDPFAGLDLHVPPTKQPRPKQDVILQLAEMDLTQRPDWYHARNLFVLQFLLHGGRISEIIKLQWAHVEARYVSYLPDKKAAKWKTVPRNEMIDAILERYPRKGIYVLPYLEDKYATADKGELYKELKRLGAQVYRALKSLSEHYELPKLTSHMARRTFTDTALETLTDLREVQHLVGWESIKTAERYADEVQREKLDKASGSIFGNLKKK